MCQVPCGSPARTASTSRWATMPGPATTKVGMSDLRSRERQTALTRGLFGGLPQVDRPGDGEAEPVEDQEPDEGGHAALGVGERLPEGEVDEQAALRADRA